jgi:hypothetical protein
MLFHQLLDCERVDAEVCLQQSLRGIAERNPTSVRGRVQDEQVVKVATPRFRAATRAL